MSSPQPVVMLWSLNGGFHRVVSAVLQPVDDVVWFYTQLLVFSDELKVNWSQQLSAPSVV